MFSFKKRYFKGLDLETFWSDSNYFTSPLSLEANIINNAEKSVGYKLPKSYIELIKTKNGGSPKNTCFPTKAPTSWADNHIQISGICGIGGDYGIEKHSAFMINEWGYPDIGIIICECPSAGHDAVMLDYRNCGKNGEPNVVHVDVEISEKPTITFLANDFETFVIGLKNEMEFDNSDQELKEALDDAANGRFSDLLTEICSNQNTIDNIEKRIRNICKNIIKAKGSFNLHADELSYLMYDIQFWLYENSHKIKSVQDYMKIYPSIIAMWGKSVLREKGQFSTHGWGPGFVENWLSKRIESNTILDEGGFLKFADDYKKELINRVNAY